MLMTTEQLESYQISSNQKSFILHKPASFLGLFATNKKPAPSTKGAGCLSHSQDESYRRRRNPKANPLKPSKRAEDGSGIPAIVFTLKANSYWLLNGKFAPSKSAP